MCGALLAHVRTEASHCTTHLTELKSVASEISHVTMALVTEMRSQQTNLLSSL